MATKTSSLKLKRTIDTWPPSPRLDLDGVATLIKEGKAKSIIVMLGAGISTAAGIPDFRTPGTGLYDNLQKYKLPHPQDIFDIDFFTVDPEPFYTLAKELYPGKFFPTQTHYFLTLLHRKQLLLRAFTQNIDTLERLAGVPDDMLVEAHGSFASAKCINCERKADNAMVKEKILQGKVPRCEHCKTGLVKPEITFFGESMPRRFVQRTKDFPSADLLIVIGTSLKVQPFASLIGKVSGRTPRLLINREVAGSGAQFKRQSDAVWLGDCDAGVERLCELLGWQKELEEMYAAGNAELRRRWAEEALSDDAGIEGPEEDLADEFARKLKFPEEGRKDGTPEKVKEVAEEEVELVVQVVAKEEVDERVIEGRIIQEKNIAKGSIILG